MCSLFGIAFITETFKLFEIWSQDLNLNEKNERECRARRIKYIFHCKIKCSWPKGICKLKSTLKPFNWFFVGNIENGKTKNWTFECVTSVSTSSFQSTSTSTSIPLWTKIFLIGSTLFNWTQAIWLTICVCIISQSPPFKYRMRNLHCIAYLLGPFSFHELNMIIYIYIYRNCTASKAEINLNDSNNHQHCIALHWMIDMSRHDRSAILEIRAEHFQLFLLFYLTFYFCYSLNSFRHL